MIFYVGESNTQKETTMSTSTLDMEAVTKRARSIALLLDHNPRRNNAKEMKRYFEQRGRLDGICEAVYLMTDWDTYEKFMDVVNKAETEGR